MADIGRSTGTNIGRSIVTHVPTTTLLWSGNPPEHIDIHALHGMLHGVLYDIQHPSSCPAVDLQL